MIRTSRSFPRRRPSEANPPSERAAGTEQSAAPVDTIDPLTLVRQAGLPAAAPADPVRSQDAATQIVGVSQQWRMRLSEISQAAGMTAMQEAEFHRLAEQQQQRIRQEIPRLVEELKPHFDTPQEDEAKQRYETGLRALKAQLDQETAEFLHRLGPNLQPH